VIELEMDVRRPRLGLELWAEKESLPVVRQALRAFGESSNIDLEAVHNAELAVTEACTNVVRHAYRDRGRIEVRLEARGDDLLAIVRDRGRGMPDSKREARRREGGLGLAVMEGLANQIEVRSERRKGTEVVMALPFETNGGCVDEPGRAPPSSLEHVVRRLVAMVAAQADMTPDRIVEALLVAELVVSNACEELLGDRVAVSLSRLPDGVELRVGPLESGGAEAVLRRAEIPALGSVVERLADRLWTDSSGSTGSDTGEHVAARFGRATRSP
jgi:anti-sigma regulatory factor (Ser/Thr protein kinase)